MKCASCGEKIQELFLEKLRGTYLVKGKKKIPICHLCQQKFTVEELQKKYL
ncbi:MAG TPA: hypothetical protein VJH37_04790 [Candidatus Nanoarchaeia archaeon]|nr:hypothetical protein [Candidatus Nanoarchaeia archaeon]